MAKKPSKAKALEMLHNPPHGKPLTKKQRKYFGYLSNAQTGGHIDQPYENPIEYTREQYIKGLIPQEEAYVLGHFERNPKISRVVSATTIDEYGTKWPHMIVNALEDKVNKSKLLGPTGKLAIYDPKGQLPATEAPILPKSIKGTTKLISSYNKGGVIKDNLGQWAHPGKVTKINSNSITMKNVPYPVLGVSDSGDTKLMKPEQNYKFKGETVTEYPIMAKSGIHIKPSKKGTFTVAAKKHDKSVQGFASQVLANKENYSPAMVKKANFARNASKWKKGQNGYVEPTIEDYYPIGTGTSNPLGSGVTPIDSQGIMDKMGGVGGVLSTGTDLLQGFQQLGEEKKAKKEAEKFAKLSGVVLQAASLRPDKPKRKYIRPEDQIIDPNQLAPAYGTGTNYLQLKKGGKVKAQFGAQAGSIGNWAGSKLFGGTGQQSGAGKIGTTAGSTIGNLLFPGVGGIVGGALGGFIGGAIGAEGQRDTAEFQEEGMQNLQNAAFQQGSKNIQNQYSGFMKNGGDMDIYAMGGDLKTHWGGGAKTVSFNPYLPDTGESVVFKGKSHDEGGIGATFGNSPVEVEGGEPAVKLEHGGGANLTVFGDMKIPSYGVSEIGDPKAKGKKFKNYINDLNLLENKQNKTIDKGTQLINDADEGDPFERLAMNSGKAMLIGGDMKLKSIAQKKQTASIVQNAILETADELNLKPEELAKGKFKKAKYGEKIAQYGSKPIPEGLDLEGILNKNPFAHKLGLFNNPNPAIQDHQGLDWTNQKEIGALYSNEGIDYNWQVPQFTPIRKKGKVPADIRKKDEIDNTTAKTAIKEESLKNPFEVYKTPYDLPSMENFSSKVPAEVVEKAKKSGLGLADYLNAYLPYLRPSNQKNLDPNQLMGEMFALSSNNLEPVQSQLYNPLLEQTSDVSYQDQLNLNQADFNALKKQLRNNPAALSALAAQKYKANTQVLGEQFRQNQTQKLGVYNRNRGILNDATLKNLAILDQQYQRQAQAKSNTKAVAQSALSSISDKIAKSKLENRTLGIYENLYNYRFGPQGRAWNLNAPAQFNTEAPFSTIPIDEKGNIIETNERTIDRDGLFNIKRIRDRSRTTSKGSKNGSIVKAVKSY